MPVIEPLIGASGENWLYIVGGANQRLSCTVPALRWVGACLAVGGHVSAYEAKLQLKFLTDLVAFRG